MNKYHPEVVEAIINNREVVKATKYVSPKEIVRAVRKMYGKKLLAKNQNIEITLTIGKPNYLERDFIQDCKKAGEPFPVKNIQLKFYNPTKKVLSRS